MPKEGRLTTRSLLYVSDEPDRSLLDYLGHGGWQIDTVGCGARRPRKTRRGGAAVGLVDLAHAKGEDLQALEAFVRASNANWVAAVSRGSASHDPVRRFIRAHCFDYVTLPAEPARIAAVLGHALGMSELLDVTDCGGAEPPAPEDARIVGQCDAMLRLFGLVRKVARTDAPVFISGASGTGKELTAQAIHEQSARSSAPFVPINCGAIPHHLLQSELFGSERGAFTGATERRIGRIESADGGTLFLDEIGDLPLESQASLLRFLQEGSIERLGGHVSIRVDARIVSATHVDLEAAVVEGRFRADLYHRLCVLRVDEPPLRERGKDIDLLAHHILQTFRAEGGRPIRGFAPCALDAIHAYAWPGNVRELINRVRRAIVMSDRRLLTAEDLGLAKLSSGPAMTLAEAREAAEKAAIERALLRHLDRINDVAAELGVSRSTLYRLMVRYGLREAAVDERPATDGQAQLPLPME
ncbi:sigma-54 dependent transcriptional regulator [Trinickia caryophylli]|uniref:sigma-54 dependent transcriptional regulator n=1 Tax=Trinickia caryophylli TaxID=28094 RepID=UPI001FC85404|nr:sigma-54 dependent transcriptional regulator [Trinickia caryophylli]WQE15486.1 sigma-54 dependent transcriptional regulator [Trinickia caryophylli]